MGKEMKYKKNVLLEVVYQLNFPPILEIEAKTPADFQIAIRKDFPEYQEQIERENQYMINAQDPQSNPILNYRQSRKLHVFSSADGKWKITLAKNMLSLSTLSYDCWDDLSRRFNEPFQALESVYKPSSYGRVAIRYIDAVQKDQLGLQDVEWNELFNPHISGCFCYASEDKRIKVLSSKVEAELLLEDVSVKMFSGLGKVDYHDGNNREAFIIDCDYYRIGNFSQAELISVSDDIHSKSKLFFRDAISEKLHLSMDPVEYGEE